ncbi:hypothetical protein BJ138DRAFT_1017395, partial [Hygrophoropsis aurantiaca]
LYLNGLVGPNGGNGCRVYCGCRGRHKPGAGGHYYLTLLKPNNYTHPGSDFPDLDIADLPPTSSGNYSENLQLVMQSQTQAQYEQRRLQTGISKPTIFLGFEPAHILGIPKVFGSDIMHLSAINIADEHIPLWRGSFKCDNKNTWDWETRQSCCRSSIISSRLLRLPPLQWVQGLGREVLIYFAQISVIKELRWDK